ncbi:hypothetical protein PybrP1_011680 [[Pythium] brassicae (nom. inval.)]|nr:hypothetical protein PybrP1_011680 [[Pythium] brassicae (nom. inval.)]
MPSESHALRSTDSERRDAVPTRPALLTTAFLQEILGGDTVVSGFEWQALETGVISEVVAVRVFLESASGAREKQLVAKFLRPEFPFESMFLVESKFYASFGGAGATSVPFELPVPVFTSNVLIVLERVPSVETHTCLQGCPASRIAALVAKLAQFHARLWRHDCDGLSEPAGIGSNLSGEAKKEQFPGLWTAYLDDIPLERGDRSRLAALCEHLSANADLLQRTHELVDSGPQTLIHGDYHVANILFPSSSRNGGGSAVAADERVWLLDWATCGKGNPMRDLAFFFIVSVTERDRREHEQRSLELYCSTVRSELAAGTPAAADLSLADWTRWYKVCVLNQFLILVVYDHLSKHLAANAKTEKLRAELDAHFRAVNLRACLSVIDNLGDNVADLEALLK